MAKKCKKTQCPAGEKWAVPYADFLSLLLALFIALFAISSRDANKAQQLAKSFVTIFNSPPKPERTLPVMVLPPNPGKVKDNTQSIEENKSTQTNSPVNVVTIMQLSNLIQDGGLLEQVEQGTILRMPSDILFESGKARLVDSDRINALNLLVLTISKLPEELKINIRGYTDNTNPGSQYEGNNYKLAADRAYNVMEYLISHGVSPSKLSYTSYGEYSPLAPNTSEINRRANNRVEIYFSTTKSSLHEVKNILDKER